MTWFKKDPLQIIVFQTYGTDSHFYARGRALEDESIDLEDQSFFTLLVNSWKRFETDELKRAPLKIRLPNGKVYEVLTDDGGYFLLDERVHGLTAYTNEECWLKFEVSYGDFQHKHPIQSENRFPGELLVPDLDSDFGIVSDIDDTIIHTGVASKLKWRVLYNTFLKHAGNRIPLKGAPEFYHLLHRGTTGKKSNPIFYVSHSPWNLYRYLEYFLKKNNFPKGPIVLRTFPRLFRFKKRDEKPHKQKEIVNILKAYPDLKFILIGDSGEHDPDIYIEIAESHPGRILAVYLRAVIHEKKLQRVKSLIKDYVKTPVLLVKDSEQAIFHARENGFVK
ncbi:DUF2183 domain-containing protein [Mangrovimonas sp. AS39]|uniref:App1 family protein n=1 Tax=Mangrovimonas futianensis TaxID=2895523 RepID=UPI001E621051|nr:phosphatase domain-containing protein [Mangrovimonas futianensis]MCF1192998.1 DUF2183 domain-containing protein [Mangrovimonas futianensis]MCF1196689.1 DUF2183 domain-containing protein [Mangrovimonas futianensis]